VRLLEAQLRRPGSADAVPGGAGGMSREVCVARGREGRPRGGSRTARDRGLRGEPGLQDPQGRVVRRRMALIAAIALAVLVPLGAGQAGGASKGQSTGSPGKAPHLSHIFIIVLE